MQMRFILAAVAVAACNPAWAISKCIGPDGKAVFQDMPCAGKGESLDVRPASGRGAPPPPAIAASQETPPAAEGKSPAPAKPQTEAQRIEANLVTSQRERRRRLLEERLVPDAEADVYRQSTECELQLRELQDRKKYATNNLAGATWESSISSEMTAIATRCDTRNRDMRAELESLRKECRSLNGCKSQ